jgi:hypothetical protein
MDKPSRVYPAGAFVIRVDSRTFTVEHTTDANGEPQVLLVVQVLDQPGLSTALTSDQVDQLVDALRQRCRSRWHQGVIVPPPGETVIPHGARCVAVGKHEKHRFRCENGTIVEKG